MDSGRRHDLGWRTHNTTFSWCSIALCTWDLYKCIHQCHSKKCNEKTKKMKRMWFQEMASMWLLCLEILRKKVDGSGCFEGWRLPNSETGNMEEIGLGNDLISCLPLNTLFICSRVISMAITPMLPWLGPSQQHTGIWTRHSGLYTLHQPDWSFCEWWGHIASLSLCPPKRLGFHIPCIQVDTCKSCVQPLADNPPSTSLLPRFDQEGPRKPGGLVWFLPQDHVLLKQEETMPKLGQWDFLTGM